MASNEVLALISHELFGHFVRLKNKTTGQEVLVPKAHWWGIKDRMPIETDAVIPEKVHLYEASRELHAASTLRIIDFPDKREWIEQEEPTDGPKS